MGRRHVECANSLKQIGLTAHNYHGAHRVLLPGMHWQNNKDAMRMPSWLTQILPLIEQQQLWNSAVAAYKVTTNPLQNPPHSPIATLMPIYTCPADPRVQQIQFAPRDKINVALTSYLGVSGRDYSTNDGVLFRDSRIRFGDITDGTSNTLLAGERPPSADFQFGWWYAGAGQKFTGSADMILGVQEQNILLVTAGSCPPGSYSFTDGRTSNQCDMFHFIGP